MSFIDKILDKMSLNSEDDEEFDNEDYYLMMRKKSFQEILSVEKKRLLKRKRP